MPPSARPPSARPPSARPPAAGAATVLLLDALAVISALVWAGGMLALGAVVAPIVFRSGHPEAPELMAAIFVRFDHVAVAAAALILAAEGVGLVLRVRRPRRERLVRIALAVVLAACAAVQSAYLSPTIVSLYQQGARRGVGELGVRFDRAHRASSRVGKLTVAASVALAVFVLRARARGPGDGDGDGDGDEGE